MNVLPLPIRSDLPRCTNRYERGGGGLTQCLRTGRALRVPSSLHVERLVDDLVGDPHGLIFGEVDVEALADLLGTPRRAELSLDIDAVQITEILVPLNAAFRTLRTLLKC